MVASNPGLTHPDFISQIKSGCVMPGFEARVVAGRACVCVCVCVYFCNREEA